MVTNLYVCRYTSNQAKCVSYFRLKSVVGPKNMSGFDLLVLRHHHTSASLYSFFCTRPVREDVAILATFDV